jgi:hypothetical protein
MEFAQSRNEELSLLSFSLIEVITNHCLELTPILVDNGLYSVLGLALGGTFDIKVLLCKIVANMMWIDNLDFLVGFLQCDICVAALENVRHIPLGDAKVVLRAMVIALEKVGVTDFLSDVRERLQECTSEVLDDLVDIGDDDVSDLLLRLKAIILD